MFRTSSVCALVAFAALCSAQPTITALDHLPIIGTSRMLWSDALDQPDPPGGENVIWDFQWLGTSGSDLQNYVDPADTEYADLYPDATVAAITASGLLRFFSADAEGLKEHGIVTQFGPFVWTNAKILFPTPITFDAYAIDDYAGTCDLGFGVVEEEGTYELNADGFGTLIMPYGTFTDVLRLNVAKPYTTTFLGSGVNFTDSITEYYAPGIVEPVVSTVRVYQEGNPVALEANVNYIVEEGLGLETVSPDRFEVSPNPAQDVLNVTFRTPLSGGARLELLDALGRVIVSENLSVATCSLSPLHLSVEGIPAGAYLLTCHEGNGVVSCRRVVKE